MVEYSLLDRATHIVQGLGRLYLANQALESLNLHSVHLLFA